MTCVHRSWTINRPNGVKVEKSPALSGLLISLTALCVTAGAAHAQSGTPNPTFGTSGRVPTTFETAFDEAFAVAIQPDGLIVAAGGSDPPSPTETSTSPWCGIYSDVTAPFY